MNLTGYLYQAGARIRAAAQDHQRRARRDRHIKRILGHQELEQPAGCGAIGILLGILILEAAAVVLWLLNR